MSSQLGAHHRFDWPRYWRIWSADGHGFAAEDDAHFLPDPKEVASSWASLGMKAPPGQGADPMRLAKVIEGKFAIVLLGRPGAGKSTELDRAIALGLLHDCGQPPIVRRGKHLFANQDPHQFIFGREDWEGAKDRAVTLVLDGVDEIAQISPRFMGAFQGALQGELRRRGNERPVRLVLSCRSAEWRGSGLLQEWPKEEQVIAGLCQLTWGAAQGFVDHQLGLKASEFRKEVDRLKLGALVVWPHSLHELVQEFIAHGRLPRSHFDLIRAACVRRCQVSTPWDEDRAQRLSLEEDTQWMIRLVGRVAATGVFGGEPAVSTAGWELEDAEPWLNAREREIKPSDLDGLRRSGHFDITEDKRLVFQHQIFREHMAAAWLAHRGLTVLQLKRLFGQSSGDSWAHFPQLATVAAWLAADPSQHEWRTFLIQHDPMVLLRADATNLADSEKKSIAKALLERARRDGHTDPGQAHQSLDTLACDGLATIVEPFLDDLSVEGSAARKLAVEMAEAARLDSLVPKLWAFARSQSEALRVPIARALRELAKDPYVQEWKAVLAERIPSDEHGTLLGSALDFLIPTHIGVRDALPVLIPSRDFHIMGHETFDGALGRLPPKVQEADIIPILNRSAQHHAWGFPDHYSKRQTIVSAAFKLLGAHLDKDTYMGALIGWWIERSYSHANGPEWKRDGTGSPVTLDELGMREEKRRRRFLSMFAEQSCRQAKGGDHGTHMAMRVESFVVLPNDVSWIIQQVETRPTTETTFWCWFLVDAVRDAVRQPELRPCLQEAWDRTPELRQRFSDLPAGVNIFDFLDSKWRESEAKQKRESAAIRRRVAKNDADHARYLQHHRDAAHDETQEGKPGAWSRLTHVVSLSKSPHGGVMELEAVDEVKTGPAWMMEAARIYLRHEPPLFPGPSNESESISLRCDSTWAFYVLWGELAASTSVPRASLIKWLPYVLANMTSSGWHRKGFEIEDVLQTFHPQSVDAYLLMLAEDYSNQGGMYRINHLGHLWNGDASRGLARLLKSVPPQPQGFARALECLAKHDLASAREVADFWLADLPLSTEDKTAQTLMAGMITALNGYGWDRIKPVLDQSAEGARKILVQAFGHLDLMHERESRLASFQDDHLAELVEIMFQAFPPADDPRREGGNVSASDEARFARDGLFAIAQERGLVEVVRKLRALQLPKTERWFGNALARAKASKISAGWQPLPPRELMALARQHDLALVRTNDELLDAAMLAVSRYGNLVRTSRLSDVWVRSTGNTQPETHISDCLRAWLEDQWSISLPREAETERGKKTDIEIPLNHPGRGKLHVTIEVKKSTRDNVIGGMQTQLRDDYLLARGRTHGLYVVFWVGTPISSSTGSIASANDLEDYLENQAVTLSQSGLRMKALVVNCDLPLKHAPKKIPKTRARLSKAEPER